MSTEIRVGDALVVLKTLPSESVQCCVCSPPYFGLRAYLPNEHRDKALEIGSERTPELYIARLVEVFREVRRILRNDGTCWINIGDSYASKWPCYRRSVIGAGSLPNGKREARPSRMGEGVKDKDLIGIPWMLAFALRADGWWLRQEIIWQKPAPMPESVTDRCTRAHEQVFMLTKRARYFYDAESIKEPNAYDDARGDTRIKYAGRGADVSRNDADADRFGQKASGRNARSVWTIPPSPFAQAHFAVMPSELARRCILAGTSPQACEKCGAPWGRTTEVVGEVKRRWSANDTPTRDDNWRQDNGRDTQKVRSTTGWKPTCKCVNEGSARCLVLDPFAGAGTTLLVADRLGRDGIGIELNESYAALARERIRSDAPLFADVADGAA